MSARSAAWPELSLPVSKSFTAIAMRASRANSPSETCREPRSDSGYGMLRVFMVGEYGTRKAEARWRLAPFICGGSSGVAHGKMKDASADGSQRLTLSRARGGLCSTPIASRSACKRLGKPLVDALGVVVGGVAGRGSLGVCHHPFRVLCRALTPFHPPVTITP